MKIPALLLIGVIFIGCHSEKKSPDTRVNDSTRVTLKYAEGFNVTTHQGCKLVEVTYPYQGAASGYKYLLVPSGQDVPAHDADVKVIHTPIKSIVCTSTTHIPLLDYLHETQTLIGFPTTDYISSEQMRRRVDAGEVKELGKDNGLNVELLAVLKPDMVMGYVMTSDYGQFKKMEELGIPVVINGEYLEKHPLGRAEWIKFMALFYNKEVVADSVFNVIEKNYLAIQKRAATVSQRPTVLSGIVYGDAWFLPGGQNYAAKILKDAGCQYLWESDSSHGFLELSFESVFDKANQADLWIGVGTFSNLSEIEAADHRYARFKAFQTKQVYTNVARKGAKGGSELLELGYLRPDIILKDLVTIAHPELIPGDSLYFHEKLK
jgi:iron complex transport system substrate-binding protein